VWKYGASELHLVGSGATSIAFSPGASNSFDVVKGTMSDLRGTADYSQAACLGLFTGGPAVDAAMPAVGDAFYYLARGRSCCAPEGYGDSSINPDPRDALDASGLCP